MSRGKLHKRDETAGTVGEKLPGCARRTIEGGCPHIKIAHVDIYDVWGVEDCCRASGAGLLLGGEVAFAGADLQVFLEGGNFDGAIAAVGIEVGGFVGDDILTAEFVFDGGERVGDVFHLEGEKGAASGCFGKLFEDFVAAEDQTAVIGGNGVNNHFGALRHFDGLRAREIALVIFAIAYDYDRLPCGMIGTVFQKLIFASAIDCIVERGASAILQAVDAIGKQLHIVGEILRELALFVEADYESPVESHANRVLEKADRGILLEIKTAVDRTAHVDEQAHVQRQIGFATKIQNGLRRLMIVKDRKIALIQISNKLAMLVGGDEQHVHFIDTFVNGEHRASLRIIGGRGTGIWAGAGSAAGESIGVGLRLGKDWYR